MRKVASDLNDTARAVGRVNTRVDGHHSRLVEHLARLDELASRVASLEETRALIDGGQTRRQNNEVRSDDDYLPDFVGVPGARGTFDAKVHPFTKWLSWVVEETGSNEGSIGALTLGTQVEIVWRRVERPAAKAASHGSNSGDAKEPPKSIAWVVEHLPAADDVADLALLVPSSDDNSKQFEPRLGASWQEIAINPAVSKVSARRQLGAMAGIYMFLRVAWVLPVLMGRTVRNLENNFLAGFKNTASRAAAVENTTRLLAGHDINLDESQGYALFRRYLTRFLPYAELNAPLKAITCEVKGDGEDQHLRLPRCIPMDSLRYGLVTSIFTLGGLVGALGAGVLSTRYGRLYTMRLASGFFTAGPLLEAFATNVPTFAIGRLLSGLGAGAAIVVVPMYISEIAPPTEKGMFGALTQVSINLGILMTQFLGLFLSKAKLWRVILGVAGGIAVVQFLALFTVVESPQWMSAQGERLRARQTLKRIRNDGYDLDGEVARWSSGMTGMDTVDENEALLDAEEDPQQHNGPNAPNKSSEKDSSVGILEVLRHPLHRTAVVSVVGVMLAQQLCGINSIIMYSVAILSTLLPTRSALITVLISAVNLIVTVLASPLPDRIGRKPCLLISVAGMGTNALLMAISLYFSLSILSALAALLFVVSFAVGLGPVPFILSTELVSQEAVGAAQAWALAANWIATFLVAQFFPILSSVLDRGRVFYIFTALSVVSFAFVYFRVPESKGKKDADEVWGRKRALK
ncbi:MAG: hypothetical protein M1815_000318 [Lichina confinis]|nr:MAG: hypothetical protein M1815_000318 [Lichina confinis]